MMTGVGTFITDTDSSIASIPVLLFLIWSFLWKGLALWHSAKRKEPMWFVAILLLNTAGILEIVYLFAIAKVKQKDLFI